MEGLDDVLRALLHSLDVNSRGWAEEALERCRVTGLIKQEDEPEDDDAEETAES